MNHNPLPPELPASYNLAGFQPSLPFDAKEREQSRLGISFHCLDSQHSRFRAAQQLVGSVTWTSTWKRRRVAARHILMMRCAHKPSNSQQSLPSCSPPAPTVYCVRRKKALHTRFVLVCIVSSRLASWPGGDVMGGVGYGTSWRR